MNYDRETSGKNWFKASQHMGLYHTLDQRQTLRQTLKHELKLELSGVGFAEYSLPMSAKTLKDVFLWDYFKNVANIKGYESPVDAALCHLSPKHEKPCRAYYKSDRSPKLDKILSPGDLHVLDSMLSVAISEMAGNIARGEESYGDPEDFDSEYGRVDATASCGSVLKLGAESFLLDVVSSSLFGRDAEFTRIASMASGSLLRLAALPGPPPKSVLKANILRIINDKRLLDAVGNDKSSLVVIDALKKLLNSTKPPDIEAIQRSVNDVSFQALDRTNTKQEREQAGKSYMNLMAQFKLAEMHMRDNSNLLLAAISEVLVPYEKFLTDPARKGIYDKSLAELPDLKNAVEAGVKSVIGAISAVGKEEGEAGKTTPGAAPGAKPEATPPSPEVKEKPPKDPEGTPNFYARVVPLAMAGMQYAYNFLSTDPDTKDAIGKPEGQQAWKGAEGNVKMLVGEYAGKVNKMQLYRDSLDDVQIQTFFAAAAAAIYAVMSGMGTEALVQAKQILDKADPSGLWKRFTALKDVVKQTTPLGAAGKPGTAPGATPGAVPWVLPAPYDHIVRNAVTAGRRMVEGNTSLSAGVMSEISARFPESEAVVVKVAAEFAQMLTRAPDIGREVNENSFIKFLSLAFVAQSLLLSGTVSKDKGAMREWRKTLAEMNKLDWFDENWRVIPSLKPLAGGMEAEMGTYMSREKAKAIYDLLLPAWKEKVMKAGNKDVQREIQNDQDILAKPAVLEQRLGVADTMGTIMRAQQVVDMMGKSDMLPSKMVEAVIAQVGTSPENVLAQLSTIASILFRLDRLARSGYGY